MAIHQFLLIYDAATQTLVKATNLGSDTDGAVAAYAAAEERYRGEQNIEVLLIGSDSLATIEQTHGHYFGKTDARDFFETVLA